jgi:D-alanine-D-alanine ligase
MKNIAVFFGGVAPEHDISVITGVLTLNALKKSGHNPLPIFIDKTGEWLTGEILFDLDSFKNLDHKKLKSVALLPFSSTLYVVKKNKLKVYASISTVINCCHGGNGENGNLSGLLECSKVALCSPGALCSSVFMDKEKSKTALKGISVKTLDCLVKENAMITEKELENFNYPLIVKPNDLGSSIGIKKVNNYDELLSATTYALKFTNKVLIEPCLENFTEINCAVYKNSKGELVVSECEKPIASDDLLSFNDKYKNGNREFPANIPKKLSDKIKEIAQKIYRAYVDKGVIRIDFFIENEKVFVNEVNTVPGSLSYYLFCDTLKEFSVMLDELIKTGEKEFIKKSSVETEFKSGILTSFGSKSAKRLR